MDTFDEMAQRLEVHPTKAQILLEVDVHQGPTLDAALAALKELGYQSVSTEILRGGDPIWVLLHLSPGDMRAAALRLTEAGFSRLKGINPGLRGTLNTKE